MQVRNDTVSGSMFLLPKTVNSRMISFIQGNLRGLLVFLFEDRSTPQEKLAKIYIKMEKGIYRKTDSECEYYESFSDFS